MVTLALLMASPGHAISPQNAEASVIDSSAGLSSVLTPIRHAQNGQGQGMISRDRNDDSRSKMRSRSEVVQEVKRRYNAEVLKISLNQSRSSYNVRVLMPNGKVRNLKVSAYK